MIEQVENLMKELVGGLGYKKADLLFDKLPSGKRLRTKLILKIAGATPLSIRLSAVIELIHAASLLHDDVIDDALTRRGKGSINALYGDKTAIMLGDILYSKAFFELSTMGEKISQIVSNAVTELSIGEMMDVDLSENINLDETLYMDMIYKKTASLIEASARAASILSGKDEEAYALYGKNLGLAFQIIDDVLDITQSSQSLGKPALNDFREGKTTLPYIYLCGALEGDDRQKLLSFYKKDLDDSQKVWLRGQFAQKGSVQKAAQYAKSLGYEAIEAIKGDCDSSLEQVVKEMIEREF